MPFRTKKPTSNFLIAPRTQNEAIVRFSTVKCLLLGTMEIIDEGEGTYTPNETLPGSSANYYHLFVRCFTPIGKNNISVTVAGYKSGTGLELALFSVPAYSTMDSAFLPWYNRGSGWTSVSNVYISGSSGVAGDGFELWAIPDPDMFTRLAYVRSWDITGGAYMMPIPDLFDPSRTHIRTRRNFTVNLGKDYVYYTDIGSLSDKDVTLMLEIHPGGTAFVSEYIIIPQCRISESVSAGDNAVITATADGAFNGLIIYEPND